METAQLHGGLAATYPDGFCEMDAAQLREAFLDDNPNRWGIRDTDRHIMLSIFWHDSNRLIAGLASVKSLAERTRKLSEKAYAPYGYRFNGAFPAQIAGVEASGFAYEYTLAGVEQFAETIVFKNGKTCYTLYYFTQKELASENRAVLEGILSSLSLS